MSSCYTYIKLESEMESQHLASRLYSESKPHMPCPWLNFTRILLRSWMGLSKALSVWVFLQTPNHGLWPKHHVTVHLLCMGLMACLHADIDTSSFLHCSDPPQTPEIRSGPRSLFSQTMPRPPTSRKPATVCLLIWSKKQHIHFVPLHCCKSKAPWEQMDLTAAITLESRFNGG